MGVWPYDVRGPGGALFSERGPEDSAHSETRLVIVPTDTRTKAQKLADRRAVEARETNNKKVALDRALAQIREINRDAAPGFEPEEMNMEHQSNEVDKLFPALVALQSEINNPAKSKQGHGYKYADLGQIIDLSRDPLSINGLAITQFCTSIEGQNYLVTQLIHQSGQWMRGFYPLEKAGMKSVNDAQQMGAAMTYARRYNLAAMLGVAQVDDDAACLGNGKQLQQQQQQPRQQQPRQQQPAQQQTQQKALTALSDEQVAWARSKVTEGWAADHIIASFQKRGQLAPAVVKQLNTIANGG